MPRTTRAGIRPLSTRFLYEDVKRGLRARIEQGLYPPGTRVPSASELTREFEVSAITVRRAIRDLTVEGLLRGRQGLGVFVAHAPRIVRSLGTDFRTSIGDEMRRSGHVPGVKELSMALVPGGPAVAKTLGLGRRALVYRLEKLILADGEPVALDITYMPRALGDALKEELHSEFIFPLLVSHEIGVDHIDFGIEAGVVTEEQAPILGVPVGFPVLAVDYTPVGADGDALLTGRSISRADRVSFAFRARPEPDPASQDTRSGAGPRS